MHSYSIYDSCRQYLSISRGDATIGQCPWVIMVLHLKFVHISIVRIIIGEMIRSNLCFVWFNVTRTILHGDEGAHFLEAIPRWKRDFRAIIIEPSCRLGDFSLMLQAVVW